MPQQREQSGFEAVAQPSTEGRRRLDLSVVQVAASALAAVLGAVLASELGVYGTIIGAAVVSIGATTGGAIFQHLFRRTGEQLRSAVDRSPAALANDFREVPTRFSSEWNEPQTHRSKRRWTWRTYAAVSALVFALAMTPIVAFELATGQPVAATVKGGSGSGTSLSGSSDSKPPKQRPSHPPSDTPSGTPSSTPSGTPSPTPSSTPSTTPSGTPSVSPSPTPSASPSTSPSSTPTSAATPSNAGETPGSGATP